MAITFGSRADWPVVLGRITLSDVVDDDDGDDAILLLLLMLGANALADDNAVRNTAVVNFMFLITCNLYYMNIRIYEYMNMASTIC